MAIATINPATGEVIETFQALSAEEIEKKLQLAMSAFRAGLKTPFAVRAQRMLKAAEILESDKERFARLMTLEMASLTRPPWRRRRSAPPHALLRRECGEVPRGRGH